MPLVSTSRLCCVMRIDVSSARGSAAFGTTGDATGGGVGALGGGAGTPFSAAGAGLNARSAVSEVLSHSSSRGTSGGSPAMAPDSTCTASLTTSSASTEPGAKA